MRKQYKFAQGCKQPTFCKKEPQAGEPATARFENPAYVRQRKTRGYITRASFDPVLGLMIVILASYSSSEALNVEYAIVPT